LLVGEGPFLRQDREGDTMAPFIKPRHVISILGILFAMLVLEKSVESKLNLKWPI
jgi:hypothetical protein